MLKKNSKTFAIALCMTTMVGIYAATPAWAAVKDGSTDTNISYDGIRTTVDVKDKAIKVEGDTGYIAVKDFSDGTSDKTMVWTKNTATNEDTMRLDVASGNIDTKGIVIAQAGLHTNEITVDGQKFTKADLQGIAANATAIDAINDANTGILADAKGYTDGKIGDLGTLDTDEKGTVVGAINELDAEIGNVDLTTTADTVKGAINELDADLSKVETRTQKISYDSDDDATIVSGVTFQDGNTYGDNITATGIVSGNSVVANSATIGGNTIVNSDGIQTNKAVIDGVTIDEGEIESSSGYITVEDMTFDAANGINTNNKNINAGTGEIQGKTITDGYATLTGGELAGVTKATIGGSTTIDSNGVDTNKVTAGEGVIGDVTLASGEVDATSANIGKVSIEEQKIENNAGGGLIVEDVTMYDGGMSVNGKYAIRADGSASFAGTNVNIENTGRTTFKGTAAGETVINGGSASVGQNLTVGQQLTVNGDAVVDDVLTVGNEANIAKRLTVGDYFGVNDDAEVARFGKDANDQTLIKNGKVTAVEFTDGTATLKEGTLSVAGKYEIKADGSASFANGAFKVADNGDLAIGTGTGTDKFTVEAASGNTAVGGTLEVAQDATFKAATQTNGVATFGTTANAQTTINGGTIVVNDTTKNMVTIDITGLKVGKNSVKMDDDGLYVGTNVSGNYNYAYAKAAMRNSDGALKAASGKFEVDEDGAVKAANGQFEVDEYGNTTIQGNLDVTSDAGKNSFVVNDDSTTNVVKDGAGNTGRQDVAANKVVSKVTDGTNNARQDMQANKIVTEVKSGSGSFNQTIDAKKGMVIEDHNSKGAGTNITGTDVSVEDHELDPAAGDRIALSDLGQIGRVDGELAAYMDKYGKEHTAVNAINSEAEIRRAEIKRVEERLDKVGAMSAAMASLRTMGYDPAAPTEFAMSLGHYRGETGMAMGLFHYPKQDFMLSAQLSYADDEYMAGIGATWRFGRKNPEQLAQYEKEKAAKAKLAKALAEKEAKAKAQSARHTQMAKEKK